MFFFQLSRRVCMTRIRIQYAKRPSFKRSMYACLLMIRLHGEYADGIPNHIHQLTQMENRVTCTLPYIYRMRCASVRVPTVRTSTFKVCVCVLVEIRSIAVKCWCQWVAVWLSGCVSALERSVIRNTGYVYVWFIFSGLNSWQWRCDNSASGKCHTVLVKRLIWKSKTINEQITKNSKWYFCLKIWYRFHEFVEKQSEHLLNIWNAVNFRVVTMWATLHRKQR